MAINECDCLGCLNNNREVNPRCKLMFRPFVDKNAICGGFEPDYKYEKEMGRERSRIRRSGKTLYSQSLENAVRFNQKELLKIAGGKKRVDVFPPNRIKRLISNGVLSDWGGVSPKARRILEGLGGLEAEKSVLKVKLHHG